jgi:light-regulated signal transduction histidine kinase (bacteriophytochrome)
MCYWSRTPTTTPYCCGTIRVRTAAGEDASTSSLEVVDERVGVNAALVAKRLNAFKQADGSHSRHHGGIGLGVARSQCIADAMRMTLGVDTTQNTSATFWVVVPRGIHLTVIWRPNFCRLSSFSCSK